MFSCRHTTDDNGIPIIIQHRYWNYYERGIAYSITKEWDKAATDFRIALGYQEGALYPESNELRRSKTYGVHFIKNYFPHRELGVCSYFLGNLEEAQKELLLSLEMLPSARAKYYVNKVQSAQLSGLSERITDPVSIIIDIPKDFSYHDRLRLKLEGKISSPYKISEVKVNGKRQFLELATQEFVLESNVLLVPGNQSIVILAKDLAGNSKKWEHVVISDLEGPSISVSPNETSPQDSFIIEITDEHKIMTLSIEGKEQILPGNKTHHSFELEREPHREIRIEAHDAAGNQTIFEENTDNLQKASIENLRYHPDHRLAAIPNTLEKDQTGNTNIATDFQIAFLPASTKSNSDKLQPIIRLNPEIPDNLSVTSQYYVMDLSVEDSGFIDSISLGINRQQFTKKVTKSKSVRFGFTQTIELNPQENHILISAQDHAGNVTNKRFRIFRKLPFDQFQRYRMTLAAQIDTQPTAFLNRSFFDFIYQKKFKNISSMDLSGKLNKLILGQEYRRFNLVERDEVTMNRLMFEHKIIHSSLRDFRYAIDANKMRDAEWYLRGSISLRGGGKSENWVLNGELIDVQEGNIIAISDAYFEGTSEEEIESGLRIFIHKLMQQLPLHSTLVGKDKNQNKIIVPLGNRDNIKRNFRFMFLSHNEKNSRFADPLISQNGRWIQGIVVEVDENDCLLEIFPKDAIESINAKDRVFLR